MIPINVRGHNLIYYLGSLANNTLVIVVLATFVFLVASLIVTNYSPKQIIQNAVAIDGTTNTTATTLSSTPDSNIALGNPQFNYTEYDKTTSFKAAIVNGTPGIQVTFTGYGILNGMNITDNGKAFVTISQVLFILLHAEN